MLRLAENKDVEPIMEIMRGTLEEMYSYGNNQWDQQYPAREHFIQDIKDNALYVYEGDGVVKAMVCVNTAEPPEYEKVPWRKQEPALVVHRFAVGVPYRKQGIATQVMQFIDAYAKQQGLSYLKADTYSMNQKMQYLLQKYGYCKQGTTQFRNKDKLFYCYDKILMDGITKGS